MPRARAPGVVTHSFNTGDVEGRTSFKFNPGDTYIELNGNAHYTSQYVESSMPNGHTADSRKALKKAFTREIYSRADCALCQERTHCDQLLITAGHLFMGPDPKIKGQVSAVRIIHNINVGHGFNPEYARCLIKRVNK